MVANALQFYDIDNLVLKTQQLKIVNVTNIKRYSCKTNKLQHIHTIGMWSEEHLHHEVGNSL